MNEIKKGQLVSVALINGNHLEGKFCGMYDIAAGFHTHKKKHYMLEIIMNDHLKTYIPMRNILYISEMGS